MSRTLVLPMARTSTLLVFMAAISSCSFMSDKQLALPAPLKSVPALSQTTTDIPAATASEKSQRFSQVPSVNPGSASLKSLDDAVIFPAKEASSISLSIDGLSLPAFINEVFANELKLGFQIAPEVASKEDLVTLRITEPRNRQEIFEISRDILASYGVQIMQQGDLLRFVLGSPGGSSEPPLIVTGTTLPSVPSTHRPIFLIRTLSVISNTDAYSMLSMIFEGQGLKIQRDNERNAVTLRGTPDLVQSAAEVLTMLDRPRMKGRFSLRVDPLYTDAESLSKRLISTMSAQGFDIGGAESNITLVPIKSLNALFVFSPDQVGLNLVRDWTEQLDKVAQQSNSNEGFYWYQVRNTGAAELAETLNAVVGSGGSSPSVSARAPDAKPVTDEAAGASLGANARTKASGNFVVDASRNMLLFHGEAAKWQEIVPLIKELDRAPSQVLVEVVIAEISRSKGLDLGASWNWANTGFTGVRGEKVIGLNGGKTPDGFTWGSLNSSGSTRLALNAMATDSNVNVLQTPKVLVRSGETALVSVGDEIQIPTGTFGSDIAVGGTSQQLTQNKTRSTGIKLKVTPTVFSDGRIDIKVSQEVSDHSGTGQDIIVRSRNIDTTLILNDGGSVLLAGLIDKGYNKTTQKVPLLGSIPILGQLFRQDSKSEKTTELMVLIVPYLIRDHAQAEALTRSFREQLHLGPDEKQQN